MKKTFLTTPAVAAEQSSIGFGFFAAPERTVFSYKYTSFRVRR
jgi:hypothetical protein